jgi:hypothetical protein
MHESFSKDDAANFTRPWFAWANTLFGELVVRLAAERPRVLASSLGSSELDSSKLDSSKLG